MIKDYLEFIFISPVTTWWGAITILLDIIAFLFLGQTITINRIWILIMLFFISFCLFVGVSVVYRGWSVFSQSSENIRITEIIRVENDQFFLLECNRKYKIGSMFEVYRIQESVEIPIGFIEIDHEKDDGVIQAKPIWILPVHLHDIERHELSKDNLVVYPTFSSNTLPRWINEQADRKVKELMKRGVE
jgi:hypothetical protein